MPNLRVNSKPGCNVVDYPPGGHDDAANSVAGVVVRAHRLGQPCAPQAANLRSHTIDTVDWDAVGRGQYPTMRGDW